jgi:hypothetical protein
MSTLSPEAVNATLGAKTAHNKTATDGGIVVMLTEDVAPELRSQLKRGH